MKKIIIIVAAILALVIVVTSAVLIIKAATTTPLDRIENAVEKSFKAAEKASAQTTKNAEKVLKNGSIEISADLQGFLNQVADINVDMSASAKTYFNSKASTIAEKISVSIDDEEIADALVILNDKNIAISSEALLGGEAYGLTFADILEKFDDSIFGPDGEYSLGISSEDVETFMEEYFDDIVSMILDGTKDQAKLIKATESFEKKFKKALFATLLENAEISQTKGTINIADKDIKTNDITITIEDEQIVPILLDILKFLRDSEDYKDIFFLSYEQVASIIEMSDSDFDVQDAYDDFIDELDEIIEEGEDLEEDIDGTFVFTFHTSKKNKELIGIDASFEVETTEVEIETKFGPSAGDIDQVYIDFKVDEDTEDSMDPEKISVEYLVTENSKNKFNATLKAEMNEVYYSYWDDEYYENERVLKGEIDWDKKNGDYEVALRLTEDDETHKVSIEGTYLEEKNRTVASLDSISADGIGISFGEIQVIVNYSDKMPEIKEYTDVLDMEEEDFDDIISEIEDIMYSLEYYFY